MSTKPVTPKEAQSLQTDSIPWWVIDVFNKLIIQRLKRGVAEFTTTEATRLLENAAEPNGTDLWTASCKGWLNIEPYYEAAGWKVTKRTAGKDNDNGVTTYWVFTAKTEEPL